jgi:ribonuclease T2
MTTHTQRPEAGLKITRSTGVLLFALLLAGCASAPFGPSATPASAARTQPSDSADPKARQDPAEFQARNSRRARPAANSQPGEFDFYLLTLSWSPEFCATHPGSSECAAHPGFVVHGLWPQNDNGTYPENCSTAAGPANPRQYLNLLPTVSLIQHEWATHGTCSGLAPDAYFGEIGTAFRQVKIPSAFANGTPPATLTPGAIISQFAAANPNWPQGSIALSCGNNHLTAVEICLSKTLATEVCQNVHTCGATMVKITPR